MSNSLEKYLSQDSAPITKQLKDVLDPEFLNALSRVPQINEKVFRVINQEQIQEITSKIKEINDKISFLATGTSQFSRKVFTLQMLQPPTSTYRVLKQILTQVEASQRSVRDSLYKLQLNMIKISKLEKKIEETVDPLEKRELEIRLKMMQTTIADRFAFIESSIKEIGYLIDAYEEIKESKNIPDNWDEEDFEKDEIRNSVKSVFRHAIRDVIAYGRIGTGTSELIESIGLSPIEVSFQINKYMSECHKTSQHNTEEPAYTFDGLMNFLEEMADQYENSYKKALQRLGIKTLITSKYVYKKLQK